SERVRAMTGVRMGAHASPAGSRAIEHLTDLGVGDRGLGGAIERLPVAQPRLVRAAGVDGRDALDLDPERVPLGGWRVVAGDPGVDAADQAGERTQPVEVLV